MYNDVIGILGGMGSFATLHFFEAVLKAFPAGKEWDRPRVIIDNRCTMPSRVLAVLEGVKYDLLVSGLTDSVRSLINAGATKIYRNNIGIGKAEMIQRNTQQCCEHKHQQRY